MKSSFVKKDIMASKLTSFVVLLLVILSTALIYTGLGVGNQLYGVMGQFLDQAQTPDLLFMHTGSIDQARIIEFVDQEPAISQYQIVEFLNIDGGDIYINGESLLESVQDNGFTRQAQGFDYLLDMDNQIIEVQNGEVYLPISYYQKGLEEGHPVEVAGKNFSFKGYLRDSQMNSPLSSSKRFLVSDEDFEEIKSSASMEYIVEFQVSQPDKISQVEANYLQQGLPANGPSITRPLIVLINALSDGIVIALMGVLTLLILIVTYLILRFTIQQVLMIDFKPIGMMKILGIPGPEIKKMYRMKYQFITLVGSVLGLAVGWFISQPILKEINQNMGGSLSIVNWVFIGILSLVIVNGIIFGFVSRLLGLLKQIKPAQAIQKNASFHKKISIKPLSRYSWFRKYPQLQLTLQEMGQYKGRILSILMMVVLSVILIALPVQLYLTLSSPQLHKFMGVGDYDILMDIQQVDQIDQKVEGLKLQLQEDDRIDQVQVFNYKRISAMDEGSQVVLGQIGDHLAFPIEYYQGRAPQIESEVALSSLASQQLDKELGDQIQFKEDPQGTVFKVVGIYSDITNGGKSAKLLQDFKGLPSMKYSLGIKAEDSVALESLVADYQETHPYAKIKAMDAYMGDIYGPIKGNLSQMSVLACLIGFALIGLILYLFIHLEKIQNRYSLATMLTLGIRRQVVLKPLLIKNILIFLFGLVVGGTLVQVIGQAVVGIFLSNMGSAGFKFLTHPIVFYSILGLVMGGLMFIIYRFTTRDIHLSQCHQYMKE